jgi:hypothetical protein
MNFYFGGMKRLITVTGFMFITLAFSGCSTSLDFNYTPPAAVDTLCMKDNCPKILTVKFLDARKVKKVGGMRNAFGMILSEFALQEDTLRRAFTSAVTDSLRKAGYRVAMNADRTTGADIPAAELAGYDYLFGGKIAAVSVNTQPGFINVEAKASVEMFVYFKKLSGDMHEEWIGPIEGSSTQQSYAYMSGGQAPTTLNLAMQQCMTKFISHLKNSGILSE